MSVFEQTVTKWEHEAEGRHVAIGSDSDGTWTVALEYAADDGTVNHLVPMNGHETELWVSAKFYGDTLDDAMACAAAAINELAGRREAFKPDPERIGYGV